jgi:hypothetical protein
MSQTTEIKVNEREAAIDTKIAETYRAMVEAQNKAQATLHDLMDSAAWNCRQSVRRSNNKATYRTHLFIDGQAVRVTFADLVPFLTDNELDRASNVQAAMKSAVADYIAAEAEYEEWSRFFLVPAGHIHSSMNCSSCNRGKNATVFTWLPELSGLTEADAVAAHGAWLCTTCFPTAPVEHTNADELANAAKKTAQCSGSGEVPTEYNRHYDGRCSGCGKWQTINLGSGRIRAHKAKGGK